ncbi:DUF5709 domain-containing protein [Amycolatopsis methanolica]|uniref:DUF5709 domain-containing protein n=1 Tax=Amycolatopsis methanolica 239 TaxID=1068978 RepID=A0A076MYV9_AMYME|nr:DUF5709 domain-containing protein [Amycolatopsis methanolica]AIJ24096.1 hypothetical protein AMETH_4004 [Amycolatopsis methanolica 239]
MDRDEIDDDVYEQLDASDTLDTRGPADPLDEGYSAAERPWATQDWGTTAREEATGEELSARLAREVAESGADEGDGLGDAYDTDGELLDDEVGDSRTGRLIALAGGEAEVDLYARDIGIDGAGASAEEAAMHTIRIDER